MSDPQKPSPGQATGDHLAGGPEAPSIWHETTHLPRTIDGARRLYGDDRFGGPRDGR